MDEVRFNASDRAERNITIRHPVPNEVVEFDFVEKEAKFLAGKVAFANLV